MLIAAFLLTLALPPKPCAGRGTALVVDATQRTLWLCQEGKAVDELPVALGRGGLDKHVEADGKVPLGEYPLGAPVPSKAFHLFIPVGYPTPSQRRQGFTGGAIGVHGPGRAYQGPPSTAMDWTLGCIAVGTDDEIGRVARWVTTAKARRIVIAK
ncbi:MAG TPA: L,D-transpeptidase family protein [Gemmatimonadales bacterium]|nr:L,D-transpeptidase family protein [Gemmatimonadales bacterium]